MSGTSLFGSATEDAVRSPLLPHGGVPREWSGSLSRAPAAPAGMAPAPAVSSSPAIDSRRTLASVSTFASRVASSARLKMRIDAVGVPQTGAAVGAGILGGAVLVVPRIGVFAGPVAATLLVVVAAVVTAYTGRLLANSYLAVQVHTRQLSRGAATRSAGDAVLAELDQVPYLVIARGAGGKRLATFATAVVGTQVALFLAFGISAMASSFTVLSTALTSVHWQAVTAAVVFPFTLAESPKEYWWTQVVALVTSIAAIGTIIASCMISAVEHPHRPPAGLPPAPSGRRSLTDVLSAVGTVLFIFSGNLTFPSLMVAMREPERFNAALSGSYALVIALLMALLWSATVAFGPHIAGNVVESMEHGTLRHAAAVLMNAHIGFVMVQFANPVSRALDNMFGIPEGFWQWKRWACRLAQMGLIFVIAALAGTKLFCFGSLIGAATAALTGLIFPIVFNWRLKDAVEPTSRLEATAQVAIVGLGAAAAFGATVGALESCYE